MNMVLKTLNCIYCDTAFTVPMFPNYDVLCPSCKRTVFSECEYGYGPITPYRICLGKDIIGVVESEKSNYYLKMNSANISLHNTYMDAIPEAVNIIKNRLGIVCVKEHIQIKIKGGALCFYGDWFGRPYDNYHKIIHTGYDDEILEIIFDHGERLLAYKPENITSTEKEFKIQKSQKIKWIYIPYGTKERTIITYVPENGKIIKNSKYGVEYLETNSFDAVYLG